MPIWHVKLGFCPPSESFSATTVQPRFSDQTDGRTNLYFIGVGRTSRSWRRTSASWA